jgi:hypothetical protein
MGDPRCGRYAASNENAQIVQKSPFALMLNCFRQIVPFCVKRKVDYALIAVHNY